MIYDKDSFARDPKIAFEIGWDYARLGAYAKHFEAAENNFKPVLDGYKAGLEKFPDIGPRYKHEDRRFILKWLHLRLNAHKRGRFFGPLLTWEYIKQIDTVHCPITRLAFTYGEGLETDWTVDRINNDGAYAVGNIVGVSRAVNRAKGEMNYMECFLASNKAAQRSCGTYHGLTENQWLRLAGFMSINATELNIETGLFPLAVCPVEGMAFKNPLNFIQLRGSSLFCLPLTDKRNGFMVASFKKLGNHNLQKEFIKFANCAHATYTFVRRTQVNQYWAIEDAWDSEIVRKSWIALAEKLIAIKDGPTIVGRHLASLYKQDKKLEILNAVRCQWSLSTNGFAAPD